MSISFSHGQFLGDYRDRRQIGAISLAELRPTVPEHEVLRHSHSDGHFLLLLDGLYLSSARDMPEICGEPALVCNPPGTTHRDCFRGLSGRFLTVSVPQAEWDQVPMARKLHERATRLGNRALMAGYRLRRELQAWDSASALAVESETQLLLSEALLELRLADESRPPWLLRAREQLHDAGGGTPGLTELAAQADLHPVYFSRAFRQHYGCSPGEYLRRIRLERASGLLRHSRLPLAEVAAQCGYFDQSHFNRAFLRNYRLTPGAFRQLLTT